MAGYDKKMVRDHAPGWVYLFHFPMEWQALVYKIGLSRNPFKRLSQLKAEWFGCIVVAACFWTDDMARDETYLLERYNKYQTGDGNEYLVMSDAVVADFIYEVRQLARDAAYRQQSAASAVKAGGG